MPETAESLRPEWIFRTGTGGCPTERSCRGSQIVDVADCKIPLLQGKAESGEQGPAQRNQNSSARLVGDGCLYHFDGCFTVRDISHQRESLLQCVNHRQ